MNNRGEKISRARILLRELSSLNDRSLEEMNQSQLQSLATEYNTLSSDPEIKDQFRRMEQSISISPTVISVLKHAKENPGTSTSLTSANSNSANDQAEQDFQVQQLREEYNRMSDAEKRNMSLEAFRKYYKVDSRVIIHNLHRFKEEAQRNPAIIYENTYHNGEQIKVFELPLKLAQENLHAATQLEKEATQLNNDIIHCIDDMYVSLLRSGKNPDEAREILSQTFQNTPYYQEVLNQRTLSQLHVLNKRAETEGFLSEEEAQSNIQHGHTLLTNYNRQRIGLIHRHEEISRRVNHSDEINGIVKIADNGQNPQVEQATKETDNTIRNTRNTLENPFYRSEQNPTNALPKEIRPNVIRQEPTNVSDQNKNRGVSRTLASAGQSVSRDIAINSYQDQYNR